MITMTPEVLLRYSVAANHMDPDHSKVLQERGAYERKPLRTWFDENAEQYTAQQLATLLNITVKSVREKACRTGIQLLK